MPFAIDLRRCGQALRSPSAALACVLLVALVGPHHASAKPRARAATALTAANWDLRAQRAVVRAGLMDNLSPHAFGGGQPLTGSQASASMASLATVLAGSPASAPLGQPAPRRLQTPTLTVAAFDALVVDQIGLGDVAAHIQAATAAVALQPPPYFGTEVVARFLGLRYTHPVGSEQLALFPSDAITRAEAAWSLDQLLTGGSGVIAYARGALGGYQLPNMTAEQLAALRIAVSRIGYPYIWGGTTDDTSDGLPHGGFDCSGLIWRVFKLSGLPWGTRILGRTAAQMAGEIPRRQRLRSAQLRPGDLLFFGTAGFRGAATEASIVHAGIYLGDNWVINSGSQGVGVLPLTGSWLDHAFAWGRRVLSS
jgi:NlpC/P60 family